MAHSKKEILKGTIPYEFSKIAPKNSIVTIKLKNGLKYKVRAKTMDRTIIKEVWMQEIYNKHGVKVEKGDTVVDIGAHIGVFSVYASKMTESGKVYAFEPFIDNFKMLDEHKQINGCDNLEVYNLAVSDKEGTETLNLSPDNNTGGHSIHLKKNSGRKVEIKTIPLVPFCTDHNIERINFLKLDCEGAEFDILKADLSVLNRVDKIIMECHPYGENTVDSMISMLEENGFKVEKESNNSPSGTAMLYASKK